LIAPAPDQTGADGEGDVAELLLPPVPSGDVAPLPGGRTLDLAGETMGTRWSLSAVLPNEISPEQVAEALDSAFVLVIGQMSQWDRASDLSRFNRAAAGTRFVLSPQFALVLDCALGVARASGGAFDPTLGAASDLWGFGAEPSPTRMPDAAAADATRIYDWRDVAFTPATRELIQPGGMRLDLSGIAKGFAVDLAVERLGQLGIGHALVEIGGELRGVGVRADGLPWWVDLEVPPGSLAPHARVGLTGWAVATSGSYRRRREADARSWQHTLDPRTGAPIDNGLLAATVLHPGCMQADALASALMVLGAERGIAFADANGIPARIVSHDGVIASAAWALWLA
jgi:thiamine biosynthesis lipoprotein